MAFNSLSTESLSCALNLSPLALLLRVWSLDYRHREEVYTCALTALWASQKEATLILGSLRSQKKNASRGACLRCASGRTHGDLELPTLPPVSSGCHPGLHLVLIWAGLPRTRVSEEPFELDIPFSFPILLPTYELF